MLKQFYESGTVPLSVYCGDWECGSEAVVRIRFERMTVQTFRDLLTKRPFEPFAVVLSSGEQFEVPHPEMGWLTRTTLYVGIDPDRGGVPGDAAMCSLPHIASVEPIRNGRGRRHRR